jgi:hypothetical protein
VRWFDHRNQGEPTEAIALIAKARDLLEDLYVKRDNAESPIGDIAEDLGDILVRLEGLSR